ncbi:MAG: caspase family protein [Muribaculaceae bacterium]|nr:caspase family protein [Muribaculaceae bacterium]
MRRVSKICLITIIVNISFFVNAQTSVLLQQGKNEFELYNRILSSGNINAKAFESALKAAKCYHRAIGDYSSNMPEYIECKRALRELFPIMSDGAYYFADLGQQDKVLDYACMYIDISLLQAFASAGFQKSQTYPILANLAATNIYNRGDYQRAINYFKAYIMAVGMENSELAIEGLSRCFYELKDYDGAAAYASQGITYFPSNWNMLLIGIESYGHNGNDNKMEPLLARALTLNPGHKGLLEYQGKMFERQKNFESAAKTFEQLYSLNSMSLDYALHLGFDLYNAATIATHKSKKPSVSVSESHELAAKARTYFTKAAPILRNVLDNSPYAVNVAKALAMCYAMTNDSERLQKANESLAALHVSVIGKNEIPLLDISYKPTVDITPVNQSAVEEVRPLSDVDINIPATNYKNNKTFVVAIGNEKYKYHKGRDVPYAHNDATVFAEYCNKVLGVPNDNIRKCFDATLSEIREQVNYLKKRTEIMPNELSIIFYYAGHGIPDIPNNIAYLLPADASGTDFESCYSLEKLYEQFDDMPTSKITVFIDACFSGATREGGALMAERAVEYEVDDVVAKGNTVVFSAASGKQTANGYDEQNHGFFTYFLLKALQESKGNITLKELGETIRTNVMAKCLDKKNKEQTPQIIPSPALGDSWQRFKLF